MSKGRNSFKVRFFRLIQKLPLRLFYFIEVLFLINFKKKTNNLKTLKIIALPRSGSTLSYQCLCHSLKVTYLSNIWNLFYQLPIIGGYLSNFFTKNYNSNFISNHGFIDGIDGPSEGYKFWSWWLDFGLMQKNIIKKNRKKENYFKKALLISSKEKPFVSGYLGHTLHLNHVINLFPNSLFIRIRRNPYKNALSMLKAAKKENLRWFSIKTRECDMFHNSSEYEKVAAQVYWLNKNIDKYYNKKNFITLHYEDLCRNPNEQIKRIIKKSKNLGIK